MLCNQPKNLKFFQGAVIYFADTNVCIVMCCFIHMLMVAHMPSVQRHTFVFWTDALFCGAFISLPWLDDIGVTIALQLQLFFCRTVVELTPAPTTVRQYNMQTYTFVTNTLILFSLFLNSWTQGFVWRALVGIFFSFFSLFPKGGSANG